MNIPMHDGGSSTDDGRLSKQKQVPQVLELRDNKKARKGKRRMRKSFVDHQGHID